jgi:hypothetical protein
MIDEEEQIHHVWRVSLRRVMCSSCLALSLICLNLKHRMRILAVKCPYSKATCLFISCRIYEDPRDLGSEFIHGEWVIYPIKAGYTGK